MVRWTHVWKFDMNFCSCQRCNMVILGYFIFVFVKTSGDNPTKFYTLCQRVINILLYALQDAGDREGKPVFHHDLTTFYPSNESLEENINNLQQSSVLPINPDIQAQCSGISIQLQLRKQMQQMPAEPTRNSFQMFSRCGQSSQWN